MSHTSSCASPADSMMESPTDRVTSTTESSTKKKKGGTVATKHPVQVQRRNARERNRVRQVNMGFVTLRNRVPANSKSKKLSKVDTLREAVKYIRYLTEMLEGNGSSASTLSSLRSPTSSPLPVLRVDKVPSADLPDQPTSSNLPLSQPAAYPICSRSSVEQYPTLAEISPSFPSENFNPHHQHHHHNHHLSHQQQQLQQFPAAYPALNFVHQKPSMTHDSDSSYLSAESSFEEIKFSSVMANQPSQFSRFYYQS